MAMKHTPGALRAAQIISTKLEQETRKDGMPGIISTRIDVLTEIIDSETAAPDMLEALEGLLAAHEAISDADRQSALNHAMKLRAEATKKAEAAIRKARGE